MSTASTSGLHLKTSHRVLRDAVELLSSMRFAIALLTVISIASVIGTVLKQNEPYPNYVNQFGPFWADVFHTLSLQKVYGSWWFLLILAFLVVSTSLCLVRNAPKMIADMRSWKDHVRERSLRAFHHRGEFDGARARTEAVGRLTALLRNRGYRVKAVEHDGATLLAAKAGAANKAGYILAHTAIVVICIGGLLDGDLLIRAQMWLGDKTPIRGNAVISEIPPQHRLSVSNPGFRGNAYVPEGSTVSTAILNIADGALVQDLPFAITLKKFKVDFYETGMPKLFASDVIVTDRATGKRTEATIKVNEPLIVDGIAIYQSSFEDGGSRLKFVGYPMQGSGHATFTIDGAVGGNKPLAGTGTSADGDGLTVEFSDFRLMNIENVTDASGKPDARGVARKSFNETLDKHLGAAASTDRAKTLRNVGPSVQYKLRDRTGQAREYNNYMVPVQMDGQSVFLAGMRESPSEPFRYLRIPADDQGSVADWMRLRAALQDRALRGEAARRFALASMPGDDKAELRRQLAESALRALDLFAGATRPTPDSPPGGFTAIAAFLEKSVPPAEQQKAADVLLKILNGSMWELWQLARAQDQLPVVANSAQSSAFLQQAINALSDSFFYGAPVFLQLDDFQEIKASVFQLTRAPGKNIVYLGCLLLVLGVFAMFYIRERRVWVWVKDKSTDKSAGPPTAGNTDDGDAGSHVLMAMSTQRRTMDFEKEFTALRDDIGRAAGGRSATQEPAGTPH
ncbi:putative CYTOCHROME C-TYPE BIOGENESIS TRANSMEMBRANE PROTEIN, ResB-like family [Cupriavidus taiwanensis]|uniref:CYTOCHROME C-TYPE BIOGENESIS TRANSMEMBRANE PROTEIN, ResB-like family n=1 Tax=Cupriavidus taiwanensis TaxID=164546 RepID=A0A375E4G5_9BURK|nr:cytochrome c biogenesis protein ResB [Cupriavidus taiwanensis]SOZ57754.1 putative CYTOCHROME C-TYPE BIOGENESIS TRANSMEMBRANE PROTEIN, ResB-like family [Cupriavidus taiwanensis]SOZ58422.1 putative CYTOCHROME C-TYPE BIOGENESIS TRANSMEMBRANE PROTEIN, ResB-like family [Cupriavidus taiwanensis]SOZ61968.1 putative CYTOCHROME C-TYPE BIOGENESIS TRANSMEMBRANE PROTEIN, ResB-like family [Cupriavidus taiwanensis]SPA06074.1 putative CYTOCHROME C-TYPE BIOGENESIS TRANSMEMBRANE PROTEIN, ResB-like family [Cu